MKLGGSQWIWCSAVVLLLIAATPYVAADDEFLSGYIPATAKELETYPVAPRYRAFLPAAVDLSSHFPRPGNQGRLNSCVGWAVGHAARSYYAAKIEGRNISKKRNVPSPAFIYHAVRDSKDCSEGSKIVDALKLLEDRGSLSAADLPYSETCRQLSRKQLDRASDFRIDYWQLVNHKVIDDVKGQLAKGNPVIFGMSVGKQFEKLSGKKVYGGEKVRDGGHAMTAVGYDDSKQALLIINSWGRHWGDRGYGWLSYEEFLRSAQEAYVVVVLAKKPNIIPNIEVPVAEHEEPEEEPEVSPTPIPTPPKIVEVRPKPKPKPVVPDKKVVRPPAVIPVTDPVSSDNCSLVTSHREGNRIEIRGFVGTPQALDAVERSHQGQQYDIEVAIRPWPQCEVLMTLNKALSDTDRPAISISGERKQFESGENLVFDVTAPRSPSFLHISYVQADGTVVHLQQSTNPTSPPALSASVSRFGDGAAGSPKIVVSSPYGDEMILAISSASPLFENSLPARQTEREFLTALRKALIYKVDPGLPDRIVAAEFYGLKTKEKLK